MPGTIERARVELAERLRERRAEIEEVLLTRTYAIADPTETANPEYAQGLRAAVSASLDYGLMVIEHGEERAPPVPVLLLAQARLAARNGVPLDTVLRRYFAGYTLLGDFIVQEAGATSLKEAWLKQLLREQAAQFDQFLTTVTEEYGREGERGPASTSQRLAERVERLLDGELLDTSDIAYDFEGWHLAAVASGPNAAESIRALSRTIDCRVLLTSRREEIAWAWFGSRGPLDPAELGRGIPPGHLPAAVALGEPVPGLAGWRLTHRQAKAALPIALRGRDHIVRYRDVALLASALQDELLMASLRRLYVEPLEEERGGGEIAFETLRAYFDAECNAASAAAALNVSRQAITGRLRTIEERFGRPVNGCAAEIDLALQLEDLPRRSSTPRPEST